MDAKRIDYPAAAERLLTALAFIGSKLKTTAPVPARALARLVFRDEGRHWGVETRRRRVRDAVLAAKQLLRQRGEAVELVASGEGYWLSGDARVLTWYAQRRKARALGDLAAAGQVIHSPAAAASAGQDALFAPPPAEPAPKIVSQFRH